MEMMLDKKQIWAIFLLEFKMDCKAAETTCNINNTFGPGTANERTVQWWSKKLCKGDENSEDEEHSGLPSEADSHQLRASSKLTLLPKNSTILQSFSIWSKSERWKGLIEWVPHDLIEHLKNRHFEVLSSLIWCNKEPFLHWIVTCNEKWIL